MAGSIMLHWRERLPDDDISQINEIIERYEPANSDYSVEYYDELIETDLTVDEVEQLIEGMDDASD